MDRRKPSIKLYAMQSPNRYVDPTGRQVVVPIPGRGIPPGWPTGVDYPGDTGSGSGISDVVDSVADGIRDTIDGLRETIKDKTRPWRDRSFGHYKVYVRCNVTKQLFCEGYCPLRMGGWGYGHTEAEAGRNGQHDANANLGSQGFRQCQVRHCSHKACFYKGKPVKCLRP